MSRRGRPLTASELDVLPEPCRSCRTWELGIPGVHAGHRGASRSSVHDPVADKRAWLEARVASGIVPGRVLVVDDETLGYALFGPAEVFSSRSVVPGSIAIPRPAPDPDSLLLATVWVAPAHRGLGLGRALLHEAMREAVRLERTAVVAYGDRRWRERSCHLPATWLVHEGFTVAAEHPRTPLHRVETARLARWANSLEHALEEVLAHLPRRVPIPVPRPQPAPGRSGSGAAG